MICCHHTLRILHFTSYNLFPPYSLFVIFKWHSSASHLQYPHLFAAVIFSYEWYNILFVSVYICTFDNFRYIVNYIPYLMYDTGYTVPTVHFASATLYITYAARHVFSLLHCYVNIGSESPNYRPIKFMQINCTPQLMRNGLPNVTFELAKGVEEQWSEQLIRSPDKSAARAIVLLVSVRSSHEFYCCLSHGQPVLVVLFMQILLFRDLICCS